MRKLRPAGVKELAEDPAMGRTGQLQTKARFPGTQFAHLHQIPWHIRRPGLLCQGSEKPQWPSCYPKPSPFLGTSYILPGLRTSWLDLLQPRGCKKGQVYQLASLAIMAYRRWVGGLHNSDVLSHSSEG